jgi:hypothetical protein
MYPIHEVDVLILLAVTIASKRRPAELLEVVAAVDLLQLAVPSETRLVEAFHRLSVHGLIREAEGGYTLTPDAQKVMSGRVPKKADTVERMQVVRARLGDYIPGGGNVPVVVTPQQACAAILAQRAAAQVGGKNLLMPEAQGRGRRQAPSLAPPRAGWRASAPGLIAGVPGGCP